jgi:hypothetical protein
VMKGSNERTTRIVGSGACRMKGFKTWMCDGDDRLQATTIMTPLAF